MKIGLKTDIHHKSVIFSMPLRFNRLTILETVMNHNHIRKNITLLSNYNSKIPLSTSTSRVFKGVLIPHLLSHRPSGRFLSTFKTSRGNDAGWILISHCYTVCRTAAAASYAVKTSSFSCKYVVSTLNYSLWQKLASKMGIVKNGSSLDLT